jgi:hypothetical protein
MCDEEKETAVLQALPTMPWKEFLARFCDCHASKAWRLIRQSFKKEE